MTKEFEKKVCREGIVDTLKYRYIYKTFADRAEIQRIELSKLDTIAALTDWVVVKVYR